MQELRACAAAQRFRGFAHPQARANTCGFRAVGGVAPHNAAIRLSGFFGLMAIETSPGLLALGSVMRTICWAFDVTEMMGSNKSILVHEFIDSF